ncbi:hypothetical protein KUH32_07715 [Thalassococcus sp. CAU 1522]|uniref:DUF6455 domain-containing protein n=1 Tax=Thalassococcus arenae TaxID=2851652 RepID=A0ABS6N6L1_9RHOB|nr:DUF6455 family protein [Thalassococcus arenae]MBV2359656.1 hypothetical protein [Thalassococcus arenae]
MQPPKTLKRHAKLVDQMAEAVGLDLEERMLRGELTFGELDDAVLRCTGCAQPCACEAFLAGTTETIADTPDYCRNAELFRELRGSAS